MDLLPGKRRRFHSLLSIAIIFTYSTAYAQTAQDTKDAKAAKEMKDMPGMKGMQNMPDMPGMKMAPNDGKVSFSGLLDMYYQYSFNHPPVGTNLMMRAWDVKNDSFSLSLLEFSVKRNPSKEFPVALTGVFNFGKTADLVHLTEPGSQNMKYVQQLYGSYTFLGKHAVTLDVGKFTAWACYDNIESTSTENYSRSLLYTMGEPFYHMGLRLSTMLDDKWMAGLYLVNGWNNMEDDNGGKTLGASISYMPSGPLNFMLSYIGGTEGSATANSAGSFGGIGFFAAGTLNVQMLNFNATYKPSDRWKLVFNSDYVDASKSGAAGGHWSGQGLVARYQFRPTWALAVRGEHFEDTNGLRTGMGQNVNEATLTLEHIWRDNLISRLEFRHDHTGTPMFPTRNGMSNNQDTLTLAQVIKF